MAPRSPTHAFDPTPALEHDRHDFSPFNQRFTDDFSSQAASRGVHFSDQPISIGARHSIATTDVPLLPSVSSASKIPKQAFRIKDPPQGIDINAYIEHSRNLNEQLRQTHEAERKTWEIERAALQARIAELEFKLNKARDPKRRSSNESSSSSAVSFRSDFRNTLYSSAPTNGVVASRKASDSALITGPPVWRGPESTPPVTRVFSNDDDVNHLPSISEDEPFPALSKEVSPTNKGRTFSIPVEQIDKTLDGIALRSTGPGVTSSFVPRISSPHSGSPGRASSPRPPRNTLSTGGSLGIDMKHLLDPLDEKLRRHAGHTPMAFDGAVSTDANSTTSTNVASPSQNEPLEPAPTARPPLRPSEKGESYFSTNGVPQTETTRNEAITEEGECEPQPQLEADDDPALTGPLMLDSSAKSNSATNFLDQVDAKLIEAASHSRERSDTVTTDENDVPGPPPATGAATNGTKTADDPSQSARGASDGGKAKDYDDGGPVLKLKKSTNFGIAWGAGPAWS